MNAITGQTVLLAELVRHHLDSDQPPVIADHSFVDCRIYGPTLIAPLTRLHLESCTIYGAGGIESCLWQVEVGDDVVGAIGLRDCSFYGCTFVAVGFAVTDEEAEWLIDNVRPGEKEAP